MKAFDTLGGTIHRREAERRRSRTFAAIRRRRRLTGRRREYELILKRYERIAFTRDALQSLDAGPAARCYAPAIHLCSLSPHYPGRKAPVAAWGCLCRSRHDTDQPWLLPFSSTR